MTFERALRALAIIGIYFISFLILRTYLKPEKSNNIQKVEITNLNQIKMNNLNPEEETEQTTTQQEESITSPIPDISPNDLDSMQKGEESSPITRD